MKKGGFPAFFRIYVQMLMDCYFLCHNSDKMFRYNNQG